MKKRFLKFVSLLCVLALLVICGIPAAVFAVDGENKANQQEQLVDNGNNSASDKDEEGLVANSKKADKEKEKEKTSKKKTESESKKKTESSSKKKSDSSSKKTAAVSTKKSTSSKKTTSSKKDNTKATTGKTSAKTSSSKSSSKSETQEATNLDAKGMVAAGLIDELKTGKKIDSTLQKNEPACFALMPAKSETLVLTLKLKKDVLVRLIVNDKEKTLEKDGADPTLFTCELKVKAGKTYDIVIIAEKKTAYTLSVDKKQTKVQEKTTVDEEKPVTEEKPAEKTEEKEVKKEEKQQEEPKDDQPAAEIEETQPDEEKKEETPEQDNLPKIEKQPEEEPAEKEPTEEESTEEEPTEEEPTEEEPTEEEPTEEEPTVEEPAEEEPTEEEPTEEEPTEEEPTEEEPTEEEPTDEEGEEPSDEEGEEPTDEEGEEPTDEEGEEPTDEEGEEPTDEEGEEPTDEEGEGPTDEEGEEPTDEEGEEPTDEEGEEEPEEPAYLEGPLTYIGADFVVNVNFTANAAFPVGTALRVREILPGTDEYRLYAGQTEEMLSENWDEVADFARFFDISFVYEELELEPNDFVDVQITFNEAISVADTNDVQAIHFAETGAELISANKQSSGVAASDDAAVDTVAFSSDSFSVFGIW